MKHVFIVYFGKAGREVVFKDKREARSFVARHLMEMRRVMPQARQVMLVRGKEWVVRGVEVVQLRKCPLVY